VEVDVIPIKAINLKDWGEIIGRDLVTWKNSFTANNLFMKFSCVFQYRYLSLIIINNLPNY